MDDTSPHRRAGQSAHFQGLTVWMPTVALAVTIGACALSSSRFEQSVLHGKLTDAEKEYYAAVWTSLGFYRQPDKMRALLEPYDVTEQRRQADSAIRALFLPLDTDPIRPGNSFLDDLQKKIEFTRGRGFLHPGQSSLEQYFDELGFLILLNGIPHTIFVEQNTPVICETLCVGLINCLVPTYYVSWTGEDFIFQEDCFGYWRLISTETLRDRFAHEDNRVRREKAFALQKFDEQLIAGVAAFDSDKPLTDKSACAQAVSILDTTDWRTEWLVINLGLRVRDFRVRTDSGSGFHAAGRITVTPLDAAEPVVQDSLALDRDLGGAADGDDDLLAIQRIKRRWRTDTDSVVRHAFVLGVDIVNGKNRHWKKAIRFTVPQAEDTARVAYGWLLNGAVEDPAYLGGRPPLIPSVVHVGDTIHLFFQLTDVRADAGGRYRMHVHLRFIREMERADTVSVGELTVVGPHPKPMGKPELPAGPPASIATVEILGPNGNATLAMPVPRCSKGLYKIVGDCYQAAGDADRPYAMIVFDNILVQKKIKTLSPNVSVPR